MDKLTECGFSLNLKTSNHYQQKDPRMKYRLLSEND